VLKLITSNGLEPLMDEKDPKAESSMVTVWNGVEATKCDGNMKDFSTILYIISSRNRLVSRKRTSFLDIWTNCFRPNLDVDYTFQYKYRINKISFYFLKEFICAFFLLIIFQYINYKYLSLFYIDFDPDLVSDTESKYYGMTEDEFWVVKVQEGIDDYSYSIYQSIGFAVALLLQLALKVFFNILSVKKTSIDKWTILDTVCAFLNIGAIVLI